MPAVRPDNLRCPRVRPASRVAGFTLIELVVTIAVLAILVAIAAPSFQGLINSNRVTSSANEMVAALQFARSESMRRNVRTTLCQSGDGTSCSTGDTWPGWIVFADLDRDDVPDAGEVMRVGVVAAPLQLANSSNIASNRFSFRPDGMARSSGTALLNAALRVCMKTNTPPENARDVEIGSGSRIRVASINATTACTTPANPT